jgi:hypothetical protein
MRYQMTEETPRWKLWKHLCKEHGLTLLESELDEIELLAKAIPDGSPDLMYPLSFAERNLAERVRMRVEDIASYAYPPGERQRYTRAGWKKAKLLGIAVIRTSVRVSGERDD